MIQILLSNWSYLQFMDFHSAQQKGEAEKAFNLAQKVIMEWDYDVPLDQDEAFLDLTPIQSTKVIREVIAKIDEFTSDIDRDRVGVDFSVWTTRRLLSFNKAQQNHQWRKVEKMMCEICVVDGETMEAPLTAVQGMMMQVAITEKYRKLAEGKN